MMSKHVPVGEYYQSFDMATHAFILAFPLEVTAGGRQLMGEANLLSMWQGVHERPDIVAATLRKTADAIDRGDIENFMTPMGPSRG